jgi:diguanylate cyclase (GGDEF)-like protein
MVTARDATDDMVEALDAGADEYLKKPFNIRELQARIRVAERLLLVQDALATRSSTDELTGVLNRRGLFERIEREFALISRNGRPLSLIVIDADNFKKVNDTYGHAVGDEVLAALAGRIRLELRPYDDVGRYGGEEFAVLLPACAPSDGPSVAERIRRAVCASPIVTSAGPITVTISAGVAGVQPTTVSRIESVVAAADKALYLAKNNGRNRTEYAEPLQPVPGAAA